MNVVREIKQINKRELQNLRGDGQDHGSWHDDYKDSAYIFVAGLDYDLTEGDVLCVFSQYGEIVDINLVRDKDSGKSKGFAFLAYEDQRSTVLAIDNFNGITLAGRTIRVDHVRDYKQQKKKKDDRDDRGGNDGDDIEEEEEQESARIILQREKAIAHSSSSTSSSAAVLVAETGDKQQDERRNEHDDEDPMAEYFRKRAKRKQQ